MLAVPEMENKNDGESILELFVVCLGGLSYSVVCFLLETRNLFHLLKHYCDFLSTNSL